MSERWSGCDGWEPYVITHRSTWGDYFEEHRRSSHVIELLSFLSCDLEFESAFVLRWACLNVDWNGSRNWFVPIIKGDGEIASWTYPWERHFCRHWLIRRESGRESDYVIVSERSSPSTNRSSQQQRRLFFLEKSDGLTKSRLISIQTWKASPSYNIPPW